MSLADCILLAATGASDELATANRPLLRVAELENVRTSALSS